MKREELGNRADARDRALLEARFAKVRFHRAADRLPFALGNTRGDAAIGHHFDAAIGEQQVDEDAGVLLGVPHAQLGEDLAGAIAPAEPAPQLTAWEPGLHHEAGLA